MKSASGKFKQFAVDIGNSGLRVVEISSGDQPITEPQRINWKCSAEGAQPDINALACELESKLKIDRPTQWWIGSVNRPASNNLTQLLDQHACDYRLIEYRQLPIEVNVDYPERVGIDRLLAAFAAGQHTTADRFVVIQAGSAVTVDLVTRVDQSKLGKQLRFTGGAILPGVPMMLRLLGRAADMLPELNAKELVSLPELPGKNTEAAMIAGCSSCLIGGVQHLINRYQLAGSAEQIVVSGGDGPLIAPHLTSPVTVVPHLVLQGISLLARANSQ